MPDAPNVWTDGSRVLFFFFLLISLSIAGEHVGGDMFVQRAEVWGVILALQSSGVVHLGVDCLNVVRHVGRLLDGRIGSSLLSLSMMVIFFCSSKRCFNKGVWTRFGLPRSRVMLILDARVRSQDRVGNDAADEAADFGLRRVDHADDIAHWPYSVSLLVKWVDFLGSLHWPVGGADLWVGGVSYVEMLILYELWDGERLTFEKAHPRCRRPGRPIAVSAVPCGPGIDIWRSCRLLVP